MAKPLGRLFNIGPVTTARLAEIGIADEAALRRHGAVGAYLRLKHRFPRETSLNALYAITGALSGRPWQAVRDEARRALAEALAGDRPPAAGPRRRRGGAG
jgi:DNA transformation protein and related proteins